MSIKDEKINTPRGVSELNKIGVDCVSFVRARAVVLGEGVSWSGVGALSEKCLHKILKIYFEPRIEMHEVSYLSSVADIKNERGIIEIQTRGYEKLFPRLEKFLAADSVTVVCPLAFVKHMRWLDCDTGEMSVRRKSPKSEGVYDALRMLFGIRQCIPHPNLEIRLLFLDVDDFRSLNGCGRNKKRRSTRIERIPNEIYFDVCLKDISDYITLVPDELGDTFTVSDFARVINRSTRFTYYVVKTLESIGAVFESGRIGRAIAYKRALI